MAWATRGSLMQGHVPVEISCQSFCSEHRLWRYDEVDAVEASVGPSSRVRICAWMMSGWRVEIDSPLKISADPILGEQNEIFFFFFFRLLKRNSITR